MRVGAQCWLDQIFFAQGVVERHALVFVLRGERTAADEIAGVAEHGVGGDPFPEQEERCGAAIVLVDAGRPSSRISPRMGLKGVRSKSCAL